MNNLEKHVLRIIGENVDSPDVFTDDTTGMAPIRDSLNDGIQELCMITGSYRRMYLLPLYADRQFYRMGWEADYFGWVVEAWDRRRGKRLEQTDPFRLTKENAYWMKDSGNPDEYMQIGSDIFGVYRKPSSNGVVLELTSVCIPKPYTVDTDPVKLRDQFQRAAVYYAVCEFFASRGDARRATEYFDKYIETAGLMSINPRAAEQNVMLGQEAQRRNA